MTEVLCPICGARSPELNPRCMSCGTPLPDGSEDGLPSFSPSSGTEPMPLLAPDGPAELRSGSQIAHFRIVGKLGRGGVGVVYRAVDLELGREVALKFLLPRAAIRPREEARFRREAKTAAALDHVNIGTIYEVGEHGGRRFIAMALYDGETLSQRMKRSRGHGEPIPLAEAHSIAAQLASALAAAHAAGIVHRDLKPSNVMLDTAGRLKLLDFGLARTPGDSDLTDAGVAVGTAAYMAPEQLRGDRFDARTDLWALGVVLYEMLAGQHPFKAGPHGPALTQAILHEDPPPLRQARPDVPPAFAGVVERCLSKDPAGRFANAADLLAELQSSAMSPASPVAETGSRSTVAQPVAVPARAARQLSPKAAMPAALAVLAFLIAGALVALLWQERRGGEPLYVAVARPDVTGAVNAEEHARLAANLKTAALRALTALEGIAPLDASREASLPAAAVDLAAAMAAPEILTAQAECPNQEICQITLQRLSGQDGRVLWAATFQALRSQSRLLGETAASSVRQAYPDRTLRLDLLELRVGDSDYDRYLELRRQEEAQAVPSLELVEQAANLRRRSPAFLEAHMLESSLARQRYASTGDKQSLERGREAAARARDLAPDDPRPLQRLFDLDLESGDLVTAAETLEALRRLDASPEEILYRRARLVERQGDPQRALALMREALRIRPSWVYLFSLANLEYRLGHLPEAREHLTQLLAKMPGNLKALQILAQIELLNGNLERSITLQREAARRSSEPGLLIDLGVAQTLSGRYREAEASLRRALELDPGNPQTLLNLADCLWLDGRREEARALYGEIAAQAGQGTSRQWAVLSQQAQALAHLGQREAAVEKIQEALRLSPDHAPLAFEAALVYTLIGDRSSARFHAARAVRSGINPLWFDLPWFAALRREPGFGSAAGS